MGSKALSKLIFALPGNPVSTTVCANLLFRPCLDMLHGSLLPEYSSETVSVSSLDYNFSEEDERFVTAMVDNAIVHLEIMAVLPKDLKLDKECPEYHCVKLKYIAEQRGG